MLAKLLFIANTPACRRLTDDLYLPPPHPARAWLLIFSFPVFVGNLCAQVSKTAPNGAAKCFFLCLDTVRQVYPPLSLTPFNAPLPHCPSASWTDTYNFSLSPLMFFYIICICICVFVSVSVSVSDSVLLQRPVPASVAVSVAVAVTLPCSRLLFQSPSHSSPSSCRYLYLIFLCARWKVTWISA